MIRRVTRIAPWQAGKFFAVLYFIMGLIFAIPFASVHRRRVPEQAGFGVGFAIALPFIYAICGLIFVPMACLIFNFVAKLVGGLEFVVTERHEAPRLGRLGGGQVGDDLAVVAVHHERGGERQRRAANHVVRRRRGDAGVAREQCRDDRREPAEEREGHVVRQRDAREADARREEIGRDRDDRASADGADDVRPRRTARAGSRCAPRPR